MEPSGAFVSSDPSDSFIQPIVILEDDGSAIYRYFSVTHRALIAGLFTRLPFFSYFFFFLFYLILFIYFLFVCFWFLTWEISLEVIIGDLRWFGFLQFD